MMTRLSHPELLKTIVPWLRSHETARPTVTTQTFPSTKEMVLEQLNLGKTTTLKGFLVTDWVGIQEEFLKWNGRKTTGKRWLSRLIKKLWEIAWDLWQLRMHIIRKGNTATEAIIRTELRRKVQQRYNKYNKNPHQSLSKWFLRSRNEIYDDSIEQQKQWIEQVDALRKLHDILHH